MNGITFSADASPFTIEIPYNGGFNGGLVISGTGITNNSSVTQSFLVHANLFLQNNANVGNSLGVRDRGAGGAGYVAFLGNATAGNGIFRLDPGTVEFGDDATAGNGVFILSGFTFCGSGAGAVVFYDTASADDGYFTVAGGAICGSGGGGLIYFSNNSTADNAVFSLNGGTNSEERGAVVAFQGNVFGGEKPTAGNATLIAYGGSGGGSGGSIQFLNDSAGGTSRVEVFGNGSLDISSHVGASTSVTIGSMEGTGAVFLGGSNLTVGSNNLSTTFSGSIEDCGINCQTGGSLTKIGTGTLTLSGANTYTGVTTVSAGTILVTTRPSSGTGNNKVKVNAGTLGGTGVIGGAVTIGRGSGPGAFLAPGTTSTGTLTLKKTLTCKPDATYKFELKASNRRSDTVAAKGVVINTGALFTFIGLGNGIIPQGTVFTAINNTAATPISGRFSNLADGSTFTVGSNTYLVSYQGGTGNDLTLTVVP